MDLSLEMAAIAVSGVTQTFEGVGLRVLYLVERERCQLVGEDVPQVPDGPSGVYACPTFHDRCGIPIMEEWHPLYPMGFR